jgi:hypothetical protein
VRQACNVAYATLADGRNDDELEELDIALGMTADPDDEALANLRAYQKQMGITFEDPDAPVDGFDGHRTEERRGKGW